MSLESLKNRWRKNEEHFKKKEVGELQDFIREVLQEAELFNLKKGNLATPNAQRKKEFTIETKKERRRADFVIFINGEDIVIPVEVKKHGNIKEGIEQLFQYQKDWNKKYGILTDGKEWRFYRANAYQQFFLQDILEQPQDFLTYWQSYTKPDNYYIDSFSLSDKIFTDEINLNNNIKARELFFDDITQVINNFKGKMKAIGAFEKNWLTPEKNEKLAVEISYAYLIQFILYKVLVDNNYQKFKNDYKKLLEKIKKSLKDKDFYSLIINEIKNISEYISQNIYNPFAKEQKAINSILITELKKDLSVDEIAPWLDMILFINRYSFAGLENEIFGFIYENFLKDLYNKENKGQYFTEPAVVDFMIKEIGYTENEIKKRVDEKKLSIIDVSCGAGTFLYSAVNKLINTFDDGTEKQSKYIEDLIDKNIFGLDIAEFPLYLAEMNILMRMLPLIVNDEYENPIDNKLKIFKTKDSIAEFLGIGLGVKTNEQEELFAHLENTALDYPSFMREEKDLEEMLISLQNNSIKRGRFDFVIGNPPYIGYNECCKQKIEFTQKIKDKEDDSITMGNVYDLNLHSIPNIRKKYAPKPNLYAFFIALGLALLKDEGKMAYIIPQTILTAGDLDVLRYHLAYQTTIEKIINFEGKMFIGRGLKQNRPVPTSSLIFVLKKNKPNANHKVKIINYHPYTEKQEADFEKYISSRNKNTKEILQNELLQNMANWNFIKHDEIFINLHNSYKNNSEDISCYYQHNLSQSKFGNKFYFDGSININKKDIIYKKIETSYYTIPDLKTNNYKTKPFGYFDKKTNIKIAQGSQNLLVIKPKYKILWKYINFDGFYYMEGKDILPMYQQYCITSNHQFEIFYLFSLLNSALGKFILNKLLKNSNEQAILVGIKSIKQYIRIPKITDKNKAIKQEIIKQTEKLLALEDLQLKDCVEFTTSEQKLKHISVKDKYIVLTDLQDKEIKQKIHSKVEFIKSLPIATDNKLLQEETSLHDLKYMPAIDKKEQATMKNYIDDLVFALYFDISFEKIGLQKAANIKEQCEKNKFYQYIKQAEK